MLALLSLVVTCQGEVRCSQQYLRVSDCESDARSPTTKTLTTKINAVHGSSVDLRCVRPLRFSVLALVGRRWMLSSGTNCACLAR